MEFENIDYDQLNSQPQFNDNAHQYLYEQAHQSDNFYPNAANKYADMAEETIENNQIPHYDNSGFNNSGLLSSEHHFGGELDIVSYQDHNSHEFGDQSIALRMVINQAVSKVEDLCNQVSSIENAQFERYISTGDSSSSFANTLIATPCMNQCFNMNSPIDTTTASTPVASTPSVSAKGQGQNAKRNMPVLFVQRVIKSFLDCMGSNYNGSFGRLDYVYSIYSRIAKEDRPAFKEFLKSMEFGNKRTWTIIEEKLAHKRSEFVGALLDGIDLFLSGDGRTDYETWVEENKKMKPETKAILRNDKDKESFRVAFRERFDRHVNLLANFNMNF